jgi:diguanylate cyclase (GGDEF)-like protein/PAS domain S-box-containing protein
VDADGQPYGYAIDIMNEVANRSGLKVKYVVYENFADALASLRNGQVDLIPILGITAERSEFVDFTAPVETFRIRIFVRSTTDDIADLNDLAGRKVAVVAENQGYVIMQAHSGAELLVFRTIEEGLMALISGNADAMVYPDVPLQYIARQSGLEERIKITGESLAEVKRAIGVKKGQPELYARLDQATQAFILTPEYQTIYSNWYGAPKPFWNTQRVTAAIGVAILLGVVIFVSVHYLLTLKLNRRLARSLAETERSQTALRQNEENARSLLKLSRMLEQARTYSQVLEALTIDISQVLGYSSAWLGLVEEDGQKFVLLDAKGKAEAGADKFTVMPIEGDPFLEEIVQSSQIIVVEDARTDPRTNKDVVATMENRTIISVPLILMDRRLGILGTGSYADEGIKLPDQDQLDYLAGMAIHVAVALDRIRFLDERKRAEQAILESEARYRLVSELTSDYAFTFSFDPDGTFHLEWVTDAFTSVTGHTLAMAQTLAGWQKIVHPEDFPMLVEQVQKLAAGQTVSFEMRIIRPDGDVRWQHDVGRPWRDENGRVIGFHGSARDITASKQAEEELHVSLEKYRVLFESFPLGITITDPSGHIIEANRASEGLLGISRSEHLRRTYNGREWQIVRTDGSPMPVEEYASVRALQENRLVENVEMGIVKDDAEITWISVTAAPIPLEGYGVAIAYGDITERKRMENSLFEEKERAEVTLHSIGDAVVTTDIHAQVKYLNPVAEKLTGWRLEEAVGQPLEYVFRIIEEGSQRPAISPVERCLQEGRVVGLANHSILINRDGKEFAINDSAAPIRSHTGEMIGVVLVFHDVTEERRLSQQVAHDAMHDSLTGLINRREFERRLERALINAKERNAFHVLCYLDLDQFKIVNDTAGHAAGDELLKQVSDLLTGQFRQRDTLARLGGDEFGLLLENCLLDQALVIANEIRTKIHDFPFVWAGHSFQVGVSIGVVPITTEKESVSQLLSQADIACYSAKDLGRDRVNVYQTEDQATTQRHGEILQAARMRDALIQGHFRLFCQPILKMAGKGAEVMQYEVLLRMADSEQHLVLPGAFIPSAERYGLMPAIDRWVFRETFHVMAQHDIHGMLINLNISGKSLDDENLLEYVLDQLAAFSIPPEHICLEITETAAIHHLSKAQQFIHAFRERGGMIALDDFGSGFSSFQYLKSLPVDFIKIDGSFVSDMLTNPGDLLMVEAITQIAHTLGIKVIAEHASNLETIDRLREIGVDYAQGYGIGYPVPVSEAWEAKQVTG